MAVWRSFSLCRKADQSWTTCEVCIEGLSWWGCPWSLGWNVICDFFFAVAQRLRRQWWRRFLGASPDGWCPPAPCPAVHMPAAPPHLPQTQIAIYMNTATVCRFQFTVYKIKIHKTVTHRMWAGFLWRRGEALHQLNHTVLLLPWYFLLPTDRKTQWYCILYN